jgi:RHS repeat-associated protein
MSIQQEEDMRRSCGRRSLLRILFGIRGRQDPYADLLVTTANTVAFQYDKAGRLIKEKTQDGSVGYELDELGNLTALNLPHEQRINWLTYGSGHVHQIRCGEDIITDIERDDIHREVQRTQGQLTLGLGYDALGRKTWQSAVQAATNGPSMPGPAEGKLWRTYRYSAEGELAEQSDNTRGALQFQYDPAGQLLKRTSANTAADSRTNAEQFAWDAAGNLLDDIQRKSAGRVEGNRLTMWQDTRFEYDPWGNLKTKRKVSKQTQHFTFDADNRLVKVRTESPRGAEETTFEYDALGRRIGKTDKHIEVNGISHTEHKRFVWQGLRMVQELRETGLSNYIYSTESPYTPLARVDAYIGELPAEVQADSAIVKAKRSARVFHFHTDLVGAPLEVTDELGELAWTSDYGAWGKHDSTSARASDARIEQPLRYPGQYADESTGLHYNTFRYYDPDIGRFISQDPIGLAGGENLYAYAPNPTGWVDELGLTGERFPTWMNTTQGYQRQHLVPFSLREHPFVVRTGMDINGASNMMRLPVAPGISSNANLGLHNGWTAEHAAYNRGVAAELDALERQAVRNNWDYRRAQNELLGLQRERRAGFKSGRYTCA